MISNDSSTNLPKRISENYKSLSTFMSQSKSKNNQYVIAWRDGYYKSEETDSFTVISNEQMEDELKGYRKVIEENGNPEWKERFLKSLKDKIFKDQYDDWRIAFYNVIKDEIPEGSWDEWYDKFTNAIIQEVEKASEEVIKEIQAMGHDKFAASIMENINESDDYIENEKSTWQKGEVALFQGNKNVFYERFDRPSTGRVANNGTFIINDGMLGEGLHSTLWAYKVSGQKILQHKFSAFMKTFDISENGQYAICQLYHSETTDRSSIALFDLQSGKLLWQKIPKTWVAESFQFDVENKAIYLIYGNEEKYKYSMTGEFLDNDKWYQHLKNHGSGFQLKGLADKLIPNGKMPVDKNQISEALNLYKIAAERLKDNPYFCAQVHRKIGEIYENLENTFEAINNFELALRYNPNVGVKKKLQALKAK
jgi:hypothetical protein